MKNKQRWREWYKNFKDPSVQTKFEELKVKAQNKTISREEYAEYQNMQKVMGNLPKVDNLIEFIDRLEEELEACKGEYKSRVNKPNTISVENLEKEMNLNMKQQDDLIAKRKEINKKMLASTNKEEIARLQAEKENINQDLSKLRFQADRNNQEFAKIKNSKSTAPQNRSKLSRYSDKELRERCFQISSTISKCDMVATNLMKGLSIDSIQVKLEGWKDKKFTAKDPLPLTRKERKAKQQAQSTKQNPQPPAVVNDFEKAFPRLAKRFPNMKDNFLGKALLKVKNFFKPEEVIDPQGSQPTQLLPKQQQNTNNNTSKKKQSELFRDYLKYDVLEVAEKGVEQVREDRIEQKKEEVKKAQAAKNKGNNPTR